MKRIISPVGIDTMNDIKKSLDPKNIFAINNTIYRSEEEEAEDLADH